VQDGLGIQPRLRTYLADLDVLHAQLDLDLPLHDWNVADSVNFIQNGQHLQPLLLRQLEVSQSLRLDSLRDID
jgi:hypothetical protein